MTVDYRGGREVEPSCPPLLVPKPPLDPDEIPGLLPGLDPGRWPGCAPDGCAPPGVVGWPPGFQGT